MSEVLVTVLVLEAFLVLAFVAWCFGLSRKVNRTHREVRQELDIAMVRVRAMELRIDELTMILVKMSAQSCARQQRRTGCTNAIKRTAVGILPKVAGFAIVSLFAGSSQMAFDQERTHHAAVRTAVGETSEIRLPDRSRVEINTNSSVSVQITDRERAADLARGEAQFDVTKDPGRPFVVRTPHATIRVLGTRFNVQLSRDCTFVTVIEGRVELTGHVRFGAASLFRNAGTASRIVLHAGDRAAVTEDGVILLGLGPPVHRVQAWGDGRLVFRDETLADLVGEMNRYHAQPMRIADAYLAGQRITGSFSSNERDFLVDYLRAHLGVTTESAADGALVLRGKKADP